MLPVQVKCGYSLNAAGCLSRIARRHVSAMASAQKSFGVRLSKLLPVADWRILRPMIFAALRTFTSSGKSVQTDARQFS